MRDCNSEDQEMHSHALLFFHGDMPVHVPGLEW